MAKRKPGVSTLYLRVPTERGVVAYEPLGSQAEFHASPAQYRWFVGGVGCVAAETLIGGIPAAERAAGTVETLFGPAAATATYLKGEAPLYRVVTRSGREVVVTAGHRFLTPNGWRQLADLAVGDVIAADGSERGQIESRIAIGCQVDCWSGLRLNGELPSPEEVAARDISQRLRRTGGGGSASRVGDPLSIGCCAGRVPSHWGDEPRRLTGGDGGSPRLLPSSSLQSGRTTLLRDTGTLPHPLEAGGRAGEFPSLDGCRSLLEECDLHFAGGCPAPWQLPSVSREAGTLPEPFAGREFVLPYGYYTSFWDELTSIEWVRDGQFYDLSVPGPEHYSAQGLWHHNSGKTVANCVEALLTALEYPGSVGLLGRWAHRELMATTWDMLKQIVPDRLVHNCLESQLKCYMDIYAPNGKISRIYGWALSNVNSIMSMTLDWAGVDEGGQIPGNRGQQLWSMLASRLRGPVGPNRAWVTGNPNGRDWLWKLFIGKGYRGYQTIKAPTRQNYHLRPGYEQELRRTNSSEWARRFLDAEFTEMEGAVYWNYSDQTHVFDRLDVPDHWPLFLSMDWGLSDPCAAHLLTSDEVGNVYVIDEYYQADRLISEQCGDIKQMISRHRQDWSLDWAVIDPSADRRDQASGETLLSQYRNGGLPVNKANNRLFDGIATVQEWLQVHEDRENPFTGQMGSPRFHVARRCGHLRDQFGAYRWGPDGKPVKGEDHALDSIRYALVRKPHHAPPQTAMKRRESAEQFWRSIATEALNGLPKIGAGAGGALA